MMHNVMKMDDLYPNKISISMSWITHADGTVEPEIHLPIDDLIEFDGSIIDEIKHFKQKYIKSLNRGEKLKRLLATGNSKKIWNVSKSLYDFNNDVENKFEIRNMCETYGADVGISTRYIRNCLDFAKYFSYYDVSSKVRFGYYQSLIDCSKILQSKGLLKKEKQFLKKCGDTNSLLSRPEYRKRLKKLIKETL